MVLRRMVVVFREYGGMDEKDYEKNVDRECPATFENLLSCDATKGLCVDGDEITSLLATARRMSQGDQRKPGIRTAGVIQRGSFAAPQAIILDGATLNRDSLDAILGENPTLIDVSLVGLKSSDRNPTDLGFLVGLDSLASITVRQDLFSRYAKEFVAIGGDVQVVSLGDFDREDVLVVADIDGLVLQVRGDHFNGEYNLNDNGDLEAGDLGTWVWKIKGTFLGDANLDGEFSSADLLAALAAGTYEADVDAGWASGDCDGSGRLDSGDLVVGVSSSHQEAILIGGSRQITTGTAETSNALAEGPSQCRVSY